MTEPTHDLEEMMSEVRAVIVDEYGDCPRDIEEADAWRESIQELTVKHEVEEMWPPVNDDWWKTHFPALVHAQRDRLYKQATGHVPPEAE